MSISNEKLMRLICWNVKRAMRRTGSHWEAVEDASILASEILTGYRTGPVLPGFDTDDLWDLYYLDNNAVPKQIFNEDDIYNDALGVLESALDFSICKFIADANS